MTQHTFGEISDDIPTKYHFPLGTNIWDMFKNYGWEFLKHLFSQFTEHIYELVKNRLDESIHTARDVLSGKITEQQADKVLTYTFFPPVLPIRSDLQRGTTKLMFGESADVTFLLLHDFKNGKCGFALNLHMEDGIPVDWWVITEDDEMFDRRHMKLGIKFKDIPSKSKNLDQAGARMIDTLKDVRNERAPQWNNSRYTLCLTWCSGTMNQILEASSFELLGDIIDGMAAKYVFKLKDYWFSLYPAPPLTGNFRFATADYKKRALGMMSGLYTEHRLFLTPLERANRVIIKEYTPEYLDFLKWKYETKGIVMPYQSFNKALPNLRSKKIYRKAEDHPELLDSSYPDEPNGRIKLDDLNFTFEEVLDGAYLDVTRDSRREDVSPDVIISKNYGRDTEFLWQEFTEESKARVEKFTK